MRYLLLVSHATLAEGVEGALDMLLGSRSFVISACMRDAMGPDAFREELAKKIERITPADDLVVIGDIAGGSPLKNALVTLNAKGIGDRVRVFGGLNLAMALSAVMGIEDGLDLDAIRDAVLVDGAQAVKEL